MMMPKNWLTVCLWLFLFAGHYGLPTIEQNASSTTLAYVTRPPLILLTRGSNFFANRSHPIGHRRTLLADSATSAVSTSSPTTASFTASTRFDVTSSTATTISTIIATTTSQAGTSKVVAVTSSSPLPTTTTTFISFATKPSSERTTTGRLATSTIATDAATSTTAPLVTITHSTIGVNQRAEITPVTEGAETFSLDAWPLPSASTTAVQVSFRSSAKYNQYYVNCSDVDGGSNKHFSSSFLVDTTPFTISGLSPGHLYVLNLLGTPVARNKRRTPEGLTNLARMFIATDPEVPRIDPNNITVTTNSISIAAEKYAGALQDYFLVTYWEAGNYSVASSSATWNVNVTDIPDQKTLEFYVGGLNAGTIYNVSITAFRRGKMSKKWSAIVITTPQAPANVRIVSSDANEIVLAWDRPSKSGVDSYYVAYRSESHPNSSEIDTRDLLLKLDSGIIPGERYFVDIYSVKGGNSFSEPVYLEIATKPLPPSSLWVRPSYAAKMFEVIASLSSDRSSRQDSCTLQYSSDDGAESGGKSLVSSNNVTSIPEADYCRWFLPLTPGRTYRFRVWTSRGTIAISDPYSNSSVVEPAFDAELFGVTMLPGEKTLEIKWNNEALLEYWPSMTGNGANISATLLNAFQLTKTVNPLSTLTGVVFDSLTSGACYTAQVYATISGILSQNRTRYRERLDPSGVTVSLANTTATAAMLNFKTELPPWTLDSSCRVVTVVKDESNHTVLNKTMSTGLTTGFNGGDAPNDWTLYILVTNLKAFSRYEVSGLHVCGNDGDDCEVKQRTLDPMRFQTSQGVPGPVQNIRIDIQTPSIAGIMWEPPEKTNGMLTNYLITVYPDTFSGEEQWNISLPATFRTFSVQNLTGGFKYSFDVRAQTMAGLGPSASVIGAAKLLPTAKMLVWAPPKPYGRPEPLYNTIRSTDFSLRFNLSMFSTRNGLLEGYSVIVAEGDGGSSSNGSVGTWFDVQSSNIWPPYAALTKPLPRVKNLDGSSVTEVLGVDMDCPKMADKRVESVKLKDSASTTMMTQFCNGPLRPGRKYRVKLRVYTSPQLFTDSDYSDVVITSEETGTAAGTVVTIILVIVVIFATLIGVVLFLRSRGNDPLRTCVKAKSRLLSVRSDTTTDCASTVPVPVAVNVGGGGGGAARRQRSLRERTGVDGRLDKLNSHCGGHHNYLQLPTVLASANTDISRPVLKCNFAEHVRLMSADSDFRFSEEYEELKQVGRSEPCTAADVPCNRNKNRFTNILPYDHSRVKLVPVDDEEGSDYINASYIPGYNSPREYVAAQGPLPSTRDDFWRMIWEQNCPAIVNLTRCIEKGREKCDQYWPGDTDPVYYGDVEVLLMNETRFPDWTVREFKASHTDQSRTVRHFHFTAWPDFGVPERPQKLVKFVRALRARVPPSDTCGPIVVHCSAGVGRSGTLIAIDRLIQQAEFHDFVDVYGVVYEMRKERAWMVQTEQQYICIHQCVLCVLEGRENDDSACLYAARPVAPPPIEIHQNPAFEDDEGIAESGV